MTKISKEKLIEYMKDFLEYEPEADVLFRTYNLATMILLDFLGHEWVLGRVFDKGQGDHFLKTGAISTDDRFRYQDRLIALAEMFLHFQKIDGFDKRIKGLSKAESVETAIGELEGAKLLYMAGLKFVFINPINIKGFDYDIEIIRDNSKVIPCEMKCKLEETELSEETIITVLSKARTQLPSDLPSIVFLKIPEVWVRTPEIEDTFKRALNRTFRNSGRIALIIVHWETWHFLHTGEAIRIVQYRTEINDNCRFDLMPVLEVVTKLQTSKTNLNWEFLLQWVQSTQL